MKCIPTVTSRTGCRLWLWNFRGIRWPMICTSGKARSLRPKCTTERELSLMTTCRIGDCGTVGIMRAVISSWKRMKIILGDAGKILFEFSFDLWRPLMILCPLFYLLLSTLLISLVYFEQWLTLAENDFSRISSEFHNTHFELAVSWEKSVKNIRKITKTPIPSKHSFELKPGLGTFIMTCLH